MTNVMQPESCMLNQGIGTAPNLSSKNNGKCLEGGLEKCRMRHQGLPTVSRNRGIATSTFLRPTLGAPLFGLPELIPCSRRPGWIEFLKLSASYGGDVK